MAAQETVCPDAQFSGYTKNGGFAEYILADPNYVAHIPAGLSATEAAPIICAGVTSYKGIIGFQIPVSLLEVCDVIQTPTIMTGSGSKFQILKPVFSFLGEALRDPMD